MVRFEDYARRVKRARSDISRILIIMTVLTTGLMFTVLLPMDASGVAGTGAVDLGMIFTGMFLLLSGALGLLLFAVLRTEGGRLMAWYRDVLRPRTPRPFLPRLDRMFRYAADRAAPADAYMFKRGPWPLRFFVGAYVLCLVFSVVGLATDLGEVKWFYPSTAFVLMLPIMAFWIGYPPGGRSVTPALLLLSLSLGFLSTIPSVVAESMLAQYGIQVHLDPGVLRDLVDGALTPGFVEELFKGVAVLLLLGRISCRKEGMLAGAGVGMGFAFYENMLYFLTSEGSPVLLIRPMNMVLHMVGPVLLGFAVGGFRRTGFSAENILGAFFIGAALHTSWNGSLVSISYLAWRMEIVGIHRDATFLSFVVALYSVPLLLSVFLYRMLRARPPSTSLRFSFRRHPPS